MAIQEKDAIEAVRKLLAAFNISKDNHSDIENTPKRVVEFLKEVWEGEHYTNEQIALMYNKTFPVQSKFTPDDMVIVAGIPVFSMCEHHLALMYNMTVDVGYIPKDRVIGLSKISRIADMVCKRLQLQERITSDILEIMQKLVGEDVIVRVSGEHSCVTARGIKKPGSKTVTMAAGGVFYGNADLKREFLQQVRSNRE